MLEANNTLLRGRMVTVMISHRSLGTAAERPEEMKLLPESSVDLVE